MYDNFIMVSVFGRHFRPRAACRLLTNKGKSKNRRHRESNQRCPGYHPGRPQGVLSPPPPTPLVHSLHPSGRSTPHLSSESSADMTTAWKCCGIHRVARVTSCWVDDVRLSNILVSFEEFVRQISTYRFLAACGYQSRS